MNLPTTLTAWIVQAFLAAPVLAGTVYSLLGVGALVAFEIRRKRYPEPGTFCPPVSLLKPVHGLEKGLRENLRSACMQDYPVYQVVISLEHEDDPALPLVREMEREFGTDRVTVVVHGGNSAPNGKVRNLLGAVPSARHDLFVISDSDVCLRPDYLRRIVAPLATPGVDCACTLYKAVDGDSLVEAMEQLTLNAEWIPNLVFALVTGAAPFCLGASTALYRSTLERIGGLEALADYLVEDYEMGRRIRQHGGRIEIVPTFIEMRVDLKSVTQWWHHLVYWDQNTRAANPKGHFATLFVRAIPFALLFAMVRGFDALGSSVLVGSITVRLLAASLFMAVALEDPQGLARLWLLPLRDIAGLVSAVMSFTRVKVVWRGARIPVGPGGRLAPRSSHQAPNGEPAS
jgi:ceramide glucosyltransferase